MKLLTFVVQKASNPIAISRCKLVMKRMDGHLRAGIAVSRAFFPSAISVSSENDPRYLMWIRLAEAGLSRFDQMVPVTTNRDQLIWTQVAGISSPIDVQVAHVIQPQLSSLTLYIRVRNHTDIPISNFRVLVCQKGSLQCTTKPQGQISKFIRYLGFRETMEWQLSFEVSSLTDGSFHLRTMFLSSDNNNEDALTETQRPSWSNLIEFSNLPYRVPPSNFLHPIPLSSEDFLGDWNR